MTVWASVALARGSRLLAVLLEQFPQQPVVIPGQPNCCALRLYMLLQVWLQHLGQAADSADNGAKVSHAAAARPDAGDILSHAQHLVAEFPGGGHKTLVQSPGEISQLMSQGFPVPRGLSHTGEGLLQFLNALRQTLQIRDWS